jgi:hypothetical protein
MKAVVKLAFGFYSVGAIIPEMPALYFDYMKGRGFVEEAPQEPVEGEVIQSLEQPKRRKRNLPA